MGAVAQLIGPLAPTRLHGDKLDEIDNDLDWMMCALLSFQVTSALQHNFLPATFTPPFTVVNGRSFILLFIRSLKKKKKKGTKVLRVR